MEPRGKAPPAEEEVVPVPAEPLEGHRLVSKEDGRGLCSPSLGQVGGNGIDGSGQRPEDVLPQRAGGGFGWGPRGQMAEGPGDVGATMPASSGRLVSAKLRFDLGA